MGRKGSGYSKARQDVQELSHCIWKARAPNPQSKDTYMYKSPPFTEAIAVEMQLNTVGCPILSQYLAATNIKCILAAGMYSCLGLQQGPNLSGRP